MRRSCPIFLWGVPMNKRFFAANHGYFGFTICAALFICGCVVGAVSAGLIGDGDSLSGYVTGLLGQAGEGKAFYLTLFNNFKYHLLALFFAFSLFGALLSPALMAVRGFFLCFMVSAIVRFFGAPGIRFALGFSGLAALFSVPCLFYIGTRAFSSSASLLRAVVSKATRSEFRPYGAGFLGGTLICFAVLFMTSLAEFFIMPGLINITL